MARCASTTPLCFGCVRLNNKGFHIQNKAPKIETLRIKNETSWILTP